MQRTAPRQCFPVRDVFTAAFRNTVQILAEDEWWDEQKLKCNGSVRGD